MLTPEYIRELPEDIANSFLKLEDEIIADISRRMSEDLYLAETADYQISQLQSMGYDLSDIEKKIAETTNRSVKDVRKALEDSSYLSYENDQELYKAGGKNLPDMDPKMKDYIAAAIKNSQNDISNLAKATGIATKAGNKDLTTYYRDTLNHAVVQMGSGAFTYEDVIKQATRELSASGIRHIDYKSGRSNHLDVAVRRSILTTNSQITGYMSEQNADMMGQDLMGITSHFDSRPSHAEWQGQVVSREGRRGYLSLDDIGYETGGGFKGWYCRHDWFPFFEGISKPSTKPDEVDPIYFGDREYTAYEASQYQRSIERRMRQSKREMTAYKAAGLDDDYRNSSIKLRRQRDVYEDFSKAAGIRPKWERAELIK